MFWADEVANEIISSKKYKPYWVDDMFTPSGFAHVGSLRGPLVHDMVYKALKKAGHAVKWTYIMNDFDVIDGLPEDLQESLKDYMGVPVKSAPSPVEGFDNFAAYFGNDFQKALKDLGVEAEALSSWDMYHAGKFNDVIKTALDNSEKIQDIYQEVSGSKKRDKGWLPLQVVCENCGKLGTTRVHDWDGKTVEYTCEPDMVKWAKGCGNTGRISPFDGNGKLPWKVDWPAHWKVLGITIEGSGKDHSSAGGSRDIARVLCDEVFHIPDPYNIPYEFFLIGGKKMSSSKGLGLKARDLTHVMPPSIGRFLFTRTDYKKAIEFDPMGTMAIPALFDEYQKAADAFFNKTENEDLARAFEYSQIGEVRKPPQIRFSTLAQWVQMPNMHEEIVKAGAQDWIKYAIYWVEHFAPDAEKFMVQETLPVQVKDLADIQKEYLKKLVEVVNGAKSAEDFQLEIYNLAKAMDLSSGDVFKAIYTALLGKDHGPKAAWLILSLDPSFVKKRFQEVSEVNTPKSSMEVTELSNPDLFSISKIVKEKYPSASVGIAVIKGVGIKKSDEKLEQEKQMLLESLSSLTTEELGTIPEVIAYRQLYKDMGVDWHSRRPSPEALLRRVALKKGLYTINTVVDAYNLIVMKHKVSIGAFDLDKIVFPTELRLPNAGEEILLLGDDKATAYKETEMSYFDKTGGFNLDFNYRDAQRTAVQLETKNLYINVDGIYDITSDMVEKSLREACEKIIEYCGGTLEEFGVVV